MNNLSQDYQMFKERSYGGKPVIPREMSWLQSASIYPHFRLYAELQTQLCMHAFSVCFKTKDAVLLVERMTCIRWHHLITSLMVKWRLLRRIPETMPPEPLQRSTTAPLPQGPTRTQQCEVHLAIFARYCGSRASIKSAPLSAKRTLQTRMCGRAFHQMYRLSANSKTMVQQSKKGPGLCTL